MSWRSRRDEAREHEDLALAAYLIERGEEEWINDLPTDQARAEATAMIRDSFGFRCYVLRSSVAMLKTTITEAVRRERGDR